MNIGIDIDGVLNDQYDFCINYGSKYCEEIKKYKLENINVADTTDMFLWGEDTAHRFWNKYRIELVSKIPARPFASEVIKKIKEKGNKIHIITARKNYDEWFPKEMQENVEELTIKWLKDNDIIYNGIYFDKQNKEKFCKEKGIDVMIDDEPRNIENLIRETNVIIFDNPYNRNKEFSNITRAYSWYDLYGKLNDFGSGKE